MKTKRQSLHSLAILIKHESGFELTYVLCSRHFIADDQVRKLKRKFTILKKN